MLLRRRESGLWSKTSQLQRSCLETLSWDRTRHPDTTHTQFIFLPYKYRRALRCSQHSTETSDLGNRSAATSDKFSELELASYSHYTNLQDSDSQVLPTSKSTAPIIFQRQLQWAGRHARIKLRVANLDPAPLRHAAPSSDFRDQATGSRGGTAVRRRDADDAPKHSQTARPQRRALMPMRPQCKSQPHSSRVPLPPSKLFKTCTPPFTIT